MTKFKVGDKVKIRKDLERGKFYGAKRINEGGNMNKYFGKIFTISKVFENSYNIKENYKKDRIWYWTD